jgi:hypothetical protein
MNKTSYTLLPLKVIQFSFLFAFTLFFFTTPCSAQRPSWSRGIQNLSISCDECKSRAHRALEAEGYTIDNQGGDNIRDYYFAGYKDGQAAIVACNSSPDGNMWANIFVAGCLNTQNGYIAGAERIKLQELMNQSSLAPGCGLGIRWDETEEGWTQVWTRRGVSNVFDVTGTKSGFTNLTAVQTIEINGNRVFVNRTWASDGNSCEYEGTLAVDGITVTGTYRCISGGPYSWRATIRCESSSNVSTTASKCGLGIRWDETEEGWKQVWTRRGDSNVFDVTGTKPGLEPFKAVQTIEINGTKVLVHRTWVSDGNTCEMEGTIAADGITVTGTYRCKSGGPYYWQATIRCEGKTEDDLAGGICNDPRTLSIMDEWLARAIPPQKPGESLRYEAWGRLVGQSLTANIKSAGPPDTHLTRCEFLWQQASQLKSTNMGTLKEYVEKRR